MMSRITRVLGGKKGEEGGSLSENMEDQLGNLPEGPPSAPPTMPPPTRPMLTERQLSAKQLSAVLTIQRRARRTLSVRAAHAEHQWKIFADLDTRDEAEMLHLAVFMQSLLDNIPEKHAKNLHHSPDDEDEEEEVTNDDVKATLNIEAIQIEETGDKVHGNIEDYDVGKGNVTPDIAMQIIEVYRKGGRLSVKLVMKLLRTTYRMLKTVGNISRVDVPLGSKVTIVGDLHGQLADLLHILDESGFPSANNKYIFNGDFVDRGQNSVEVICILLALYVAEPENVVLNRGNHEDIAINRVYGFQAECVDKYGELTYGMFCEVFRYLPLFVLVNEEIFIVHAGLFHDAEVRLADLEQIDRLDYITRPPVLYPENTVGLSPEDCRKEYLKQLQRDALWSDPMEDEGIEDNPRGAGVCFGPDVAQQFLSLNKLSMVIRSHECVRAGFCLHYVGDQDTDVCPPNVPLVCTIFSASNYCNGDNFGAYITVLPHMFSGAQPIGNSGLFYTHHKYKTSTAQMALEVQNKMSLTGLIVRKRTALHLAFEAADTSNSHVVSRLEWAEIMLRVTGIKIRWLSILPSLAPPDCLAAKTVNYAKFLAAFTTDALARNQEASQPGAEGGSGGMKVMDVMYMQRKRLETVFYYFDSNGDGRVSREEFRKGCDLINNSLPADSDQRLTNIDHTLDLMDFDGTGDIDINEFFEVFRILDAKDGKVDGVLSLAQNAKKPAS